MAIEPFFRAVLTLALAQCAWLVWTALYRLYFSPLAKIPGPRLAALTSWYEFYYDVILPGRYVFKIKELHEEYGASSPFPFRPISTFAVDKRKKAHGDPAGPIIRVAPNEVHVNDVEFLDTIYPISNTHKRDKDWTQIRGLDVGMSTSATLSHDLHRRRRESLNPFFSQKNVAALEPLIKDKVKQLCGHLDDATKTGKPVNLYDLYYALARE